MNYYYYESVSTLEQFCVRCILITTQKGGGYTFVVIYSTESKKAEIKIWDHKSVVLNNCGMLNSNP